MSPVSFLENLYISYNPVLNSPSPSPDPDFDEGNLQDCMVGFKILRLIPEEKFWQKWKAGVELRMERYL